MLANLINLFPFGLLTLFVTSVYQLFGGLSEGFDARSLWLVWGGMAIIAHKLKTIAGADQIIVLDKGKIVESGNHESLIENRGLYEHLWNIQQITVGWQLDILP